jgi:hypothetical protein
MLEMADISVPPAVIHFCNNQRRIQNKQFPLFSLSWQKLKRPFYIILQGISYFQNKIYSTELYLYYI